MGGRDRPAAAHGRRHAGLRLRCAPQFPPVVPDQGSARDGRTYRSHPHPPGLSRRFPMFKTILVPVDLGEIGAAQPALDKAVELAALSEGSIRLIYVRAIVPVTYMEFMPPAFDQEQQDEAEKKLAKLAAQVK